MSLEGRQSHWASGSLQCVCCCRRSWSCSDKSLSEKIERDSWGLPPRGLGLLALCDGNAGWSPLWGRDPSKTNCGYPGKKQGAPRRWGYRPTVRAPVPNFDARERADALLEVPRGLSSSPSSWWSYVIARFVCLLPFPLSLKLVSNKHFHTLEYFFIDPHLYSPKRKLFLPIKASGIDWEVPP